MVFCFRRVREYMSLSDCAAKDPPFLTGHGDNDFSYMNDEIALPAGEREKGSSHRISIVDRNFIVLDTS